MATRREAKVMVTNDTREEIWSVSVTHKYEDRHREILDFTERLGKGSSSYFHQTPINFRTGPWETGVDWWFVCWTSADGYLHLTSPFTFGQALRGLKIWESKGWISELKGLLKFITEVQGKSADDKSADALNLTHSVASKYFEGKGETGGMKQHMLRENDNVDIHLNERKVTFRSRSGVSTCECISFSEKEINSKESWLWATILNAPTE